MKPTIARYRRLPTEIEAFQWSPSITHPAVLPFVHYVDDEKCDSCGGVLRKHGWVKTLEGGHRVCPGDWIIRGFVGEFYPCKSIVFQSTYERIVATEAEDA